MSLLKDISELIEEYEKDGYHVLNILYRANKIININFESENPTYYSYRNVTLHIKYNTLTLMDDEIIDKNEGLYLSAISPQIAVYPQFPF